MEGREEATPNEKPVKQKNLAKEKKDEALHIDRTLIPTVPLSQTFSGTTLDNLSRLGVSTYPCYVDEILQILK